jgi:HK97 family phage prohead protease
MLERRVITPGSVRASGEGQDKTIVGYAACFGVLSEPIGFGGGFTEKIDPHAFDKCLAASPDVRCLWNHSPDHVLGRTKSGTLSLKVDDVGLQYTCKLPGTSVADDLFESIKRGDITGSSFGFEAVKDSWDTKTNTRTLLQANVFDVAPVTFPAYGQTSVQVRSMHGRMETIEFGVYRSRSLRPPSLPLTAIQMKRRARALVRELGGEQRELGADCDCECENCASGNCEDCNCTENCPGEGCGSVDCNCSEHRHRLRSTEPRTIVPLGSSIAELEAEALERELNWLRLQAKAASAR